jgi:hypothetical protein
MDRAGGVAEFAAGVFAVFLHGGDGGLQIPDVVARVEDSHDVHAGLRHGTNKRLHYIVREAGVLHDVLPAQKHDVRRIRSGLLQRAQAVEGIFMEKAQAGIDRRSSPGFQSAEAQFVEDRSRRQHLRGGHACSRERLVTVAQHSVIKDYRRGHILWRDAIQCVAGRLRAYCLLLCTG